MKDNLAILEETMSTTRLECSKCAEAFEVSDDIAAAIHAWRDQSSEPFLCMECSVSIAWGEAILANELKIETEHEGQ